MKFKYREPGVRLEVGTLPSDFIADAIFNVVGVRETARLAGVSAASVSEWAHGKCVLPWSTAMRIVKAVGQEDSMWTVTLYDRVSACERLGFDFHDRLEDAQARDRRERDVAERVERE